VSDPFSATLAADHPRIAALAADIERRTSHGRPAERERALLAELLERSRSRHAARLARIPQPRFPEDLPIAQHREEIARLVRDHPVTIVCGETGSGKTTQIPKICLTLGRGAAGLIGCTQPRRIAARSLANRLAQELAGTPKGFVGHKIRFQDQTRPDTVVKVMTDGILLAETHSDRELRAYDTIVIDEAHERSLNVDFLLGYVKRLVTRRPELKVIVTSATIDTARFSEFFGGAPVIEVSGRTYPVEVRYRAELFEPEEADDEPVDMPEAIAKAVDEIARTSREGDILVFLPGEREIREAAEALRKLSPQAGQKGHTEILPLFSRLSAEEQDRVFERGGHRRIVLSTNVAETSLTVPGIHFVIDTGLARVKRYSPRQKIDQLRIEPISQAAARQRAGRCGRVASGVAIRLYAEEDFNGRPEFTTPEILRTSLASVILRMASLELGPIADFPFIEPPTPRQVEDGYRLLFELGAIDGERNLTPLGRELARLPVDPRIGRMLLGAREFHCASELVILAAALSIQDPRDRPQALREASDRAHEEFRDDSSDFLQLLNLWRFFDTEFVHKKSNRKLYETCRDHFLSYVRMREWRDLAGQLREMAGELKLHENKAPATYEQVHRALLTGLIGNVGLKGTEGDPYNGPRGLQFHIWPGSGLKKGRPRWIMAGELQETTRVFARNVARIEPEWIEKAAGHLVERAFVEPHWDKARGEVVAYENVSLYGLVLVARRKVSFGRLDPARAREIFIESALVAGEFESPHPFWAHNRGPGARGGGPGASRPPPGRAGRRSRDLRLLRAPASRRRARRALVRRVVPRGRAQGSEAALPGQVGPHAPRRGVGDRGALPAAGEDGRGDLPARLSLRARPSAGRRHHQRPPRAAEPGRGRDRGLAGARHGAREGRLDHEGAAEEGPLAAGAGARARDPVPREDRGWRKAHRRRRAGIRLPHRRRAPRRRHLVEGRAALAPHDEHPRPRRGQARARDGPRSRGAAQAPGRGRQPHAGEGTARHRTRERDRVGFRRPCRRR
jgi:ATP-dependent helicase HrpA